MGWASEQLWRDLARVGIYPMRNEPEQPESREDCPFIVQDENTGNKVCDLDGGKCEFNV